jgi:hypothetical protein
MPRGVQLEFARMKRIISCVSLLIGSSLAGLSTSSATPQPLPSPFPETRYQQMTVKSPFAVATAAVAPAATPGFASDLYVDGVAHVGNTDYVAIKSRDPTKPVAIFLEVGESTGDGIKVEHVTWSEDMGKSTVDVTKDGAKATLIFDEQTVKVAGRGAEIAANAAGGADQEPEAPRPIDGPYAHPPIRRIRPIQINH